MMQQVIDQNGAREFRLVLRDEGDEASRIRRLRACLKTMLRTFQFRNVRLEPAADEATVNEGGQ